MEADKPSYHVKVTEIPQCNVYHSIPIPALVVVVGDSILFVLHFCAIFRTSNLEDYVAALLNPEVLKVPLAWLG